MASQLGTGLSRRSPAWFWVIVTGLPALYFVWSGNPILAALFAVAATLIILEPRLRTEYETVQVDSVGVLRIAGPVREHVHWNDIDEIKIVTTSDGPWAEDVFFVLVAANGKGCVIPHEAAVRAKLLEALQAHFPSLDDKLVIKAMGCTSNNSFLIWKKEDHAV